MAENNESLARCALRRTLLPEAGQSRKEQRTESMLRNNARQPACKVGVRLAQDGVECKEHDGRTMWIFTSSSLDPRLHFYSKR